MKRLLFLFSTFLAFAACSTSQPDDEATHESVRKAAETYYTMLINGQYQDFVAGIADADSMPEDFRSQLVDMTAQHADQINKKSPMLKVVATADSLQDSTAFVFLDLYFQDNSVEQIGVPMVLKDKRWKMK